MKLYQKVALVALAILPLAFKGHAANARLPKIPVREISAFKPSPDTLIRRDFEKIRGGEGGDSKPDSANVEGPGKKAYFQNEIETAREDRRGFLSFCSLLENLYSKQDYGQYINWFGTVEMHLPGWERLKSLNRALHKEYGRLTSIQVMQKKEKSRQAVKKIARKKKKILEMNGEVSQMLDYYADALGKILVNAVSSDFHLGNYEHALYGAESLLNELDELKPENKKMLLEICRDSCLKLGKVDGYLFYQKCLEELK